MNCGLSSKSFGGYPVTDSSGNTTSSRPLPLARAMKSRILPHVPGNVADGRIDLGKGDSHIE